MNKKVLFVDDEVNVLQAYKRGLRRNFTLDTAIGGEEALELIASQGPYGVIVADMRMPGMNGVELLAEVKQRAPEMVRMMLTGNSDQQTAIDAVNEGDIFRFLNKPCPPEQLAKALLAGLEQHRLMTAEKELLENTLRGSVQALAEVLSLASPEAFGRTTRIKRYMSELAQAMELAEVWRMETLGLLSQIGCVTLPEQVSKKLASGRALSEDEVELFDKHPGVGAALLGKIPRLEEIAESIAYQEKHFDGTGIPSGGRRGEDIPLGARLLKVVLDFDKWQMSGLTPERALARLKSHAESYDPQVLAALTKVSGAETAMITREIPVTGLADGMFLALDVETRDGILLVCKGQETTRSVREHLLNFCRNGAVGKLVSVSMTAEIESGAQATG